MSQELCIGTAQFGLEYGITNTKGRVKEREITKIIEKAEEVNIRWFDTASAYGNAEKILGDKIKSRDIKIITKLKENNEDEGKQTIESMWEKKLSNSRNNLGENRINTLMMHSSNDLKGKNSEVLAKWLNEKKKEGIIKRTGLSIYKLEELQGIDENVIDVIQLPLSIYDQRAVASKKLQELKDKGKIIMARSIYLQGLIVSEVKDWPIWVKEEHRIKHQNLISLAKEMNCKVIDLALNFVRTRKMVDIVVIGICNMEQLLELNTSWRRSKNEKGIDWNKWGIQDEDLIDPRRWPS